MHGECDWGNMFPNDQERIVLVHYLENVILLVSGDTFHIDQEEVAPVVQHHMGHDVHLLIDYYTYDLLQVVQQKIWFLDGIHNG